MGNVTLEPEGNEPAPSTAGTSQVAIPNTVIVADLNALAAQIYSAIAAASGIKAFCDLVQPVHNAFTALSKESPPAQTPPSAGMTLVGLDDDTAFVVGIEATAL